MEHVEITWDDEAQTIICCAFTQGWTLDDFHEAYSQTGNMIRQSPNRVLGIIVDDSHNTSPPPNALTAFKRVFKNGTLPMAIIGGHQLTKLLMKVVESSIVSERQILRANDIHEAREILEQSAKNLG
jgi:hypothetical protein